jgi:hypothetical protein
MVTLRKVNDQRGVPMDTLINARYVPSGSNGNWASEALDIFTTAVAESFGIDPTAVERVALTTVPYQPGICAGTLGFAVPAKPDVLILANIGVFDEPGLAKSERRARILIPAALP